MHQVSYTCCAHTSSSGVAMGIATGFPMLWLSIFAAAIEFTWIFNSTNGSLVMVIIFHALFDLLSVSKAGGAMTATIMSAAVMGGAVLIVVWYGPTTLSRTGKQTMPAMLTATQA